MGFGWGWDAWPSLATPWIWLWVKTIGIHFGVGALLILVTLVGIGMFTGGTIWLLTNGHMTVDSRGSEDQQKLDLPLTLGACAHQREIRGHHEVRSRMQRVGN